MADQNVSLGDAYAELRSGIDQWSSKLGGTSFSDAIVASGAREALQNIIRRTPKGPERLAVFCEPYMASAAQLLATAAALDHLFAIRDDGISYAGVLEGRAMLHLREHRLYLETPDAAVLLAFAYSYSEHQWTVALDKQGETLLRHLKREGPRNSIHHTKTESGAVTTLLRIAEQHFGVKLERVPVTAT